jgi:amidase/aspartyl-tRNA(Asn)/glutamyl-tRNA(Gln) amidotransferase subunit A
MDQDLSYASAGDIANAIRQKRVSPLEVLDFFIDRIEARNPSLNAVVYKGYDDARAAARRAEKAVMKGEALGPLHGVPVAIKDLFDFNPGWPATFGGIRALKNFKTDFCCAFAERIAQRGGAIIVGKTNSPVMGFRGTCDNYLFGPTCNPFDIRKNSGGSSGGSAAAVADGLLPLAEGTDGGGSIRIPASWCGVYGYKASFGRVPIWTRPNAFAMDTPFIVEGPITRNVRDAALALTALAGFDARDPFSLDDDLDFMAATERPIKGLRIAYSPNFDVFPVDPEVLAIVEGAVRAFEEEGAVVREIKLGITRSQRELSDLWSRLIMPLNITGLLGLQGAGYDLLGEYRSDLPPEYLRWVDECMNMSAVQFFNDQAIRTEIYDAIQNVFQENDILVTPTLACLPVDNLSDGNTVGPSEVAGEEVDPLIGWCLTYPLNFSGNPAASIPAGLSAGGLPVGMQIIGSRYADLDVIAASAAFERVRPWQHTYDRCRARLL